MRRLTVQGISEVTRWHGVLCVVVALMSPAAAEAQARLTGGDITGVVLDASSGVLPGTMITVTHRATNLTREVVSDGKGRFVVAALTPGTYRVRADIAGFEGDTREAVELSLGQSLDLTFTLRVAGAKETVTVTAEPQLAGLRDASVRAVVGRPQIDSLPINGRNFISFAALTPGVALDTTPQQGATMTSGLSFAGQRPRSNNVMVDGFDNNDLAVGAIRAVFSQEAIREFQVLTNSYSAEFGKASGGVVNIITRSGTNDVHGSLFEFFRDQRLNAKAHFELVDVFGDPVMSGTVPFRQHQFGGTLGGPVRQDRTFYFLSVERRDTIAASVVTIDPDAAAILNSAGFAVTTGPNRFVVRQTQGLAKVEHQWRPASTLVLRTNYSHGLDEGSAPFGGLVARSRGAAQRATDVSLATSQTDVWSSRWVHEARAQYARQDQDFLALDPACGGACETRDQGGPTVEVAGVASVGRLRLTPQLRLSDRVQVADTVSYFRGTHQIKAGLDFNWLHSRDALPSNFGGRFVFPSLAALVAGTPAAYVQAYGNDVTRYSYSDISIFLQDEWRAGKRLTIHSGVRYQAQIWPPLRYDVSDVGGSRFQYGFPSDWNNLAPRVAVAFDPAGDGRSAVRGSYGLFFDNHITSTILVTSVIRGTDDGVRTLAAGGAVAQAAWRAPGRRLSEAQAAALLGGPFPSAVATIDPGLETPVAHHVSLGYDRAIGTEATLSATLLYVRGRHQLATLDYNPIIPALGGPSRRPNDINGVAGTSAPVLQYTDVGETWYRGVTVSAQKRNSRASQVLVSYTLSSATDNATDFQTIFVAEDFGLGRNPADRSGLPLAFDPNREKGPAIGDQRHRLVVSGFHAFGRGLSVSAILTAGSGRPFTPLAGADLNGDGNGGAPPPDRARANPADPATSVGRHSARLPGQLTVDARVTRKFREGNRVRLEAIVEAFNLFNRTNYSAVNDVFGRGAFPDSPAADAKGRVTYGRFTQAFPPRQIQLAMRLTF